ncbi:MAG TPA: hypothetical protein VFB98_02455, partial [Candidatus Deferrimicrobium sp.]|nr:hypothetical protein [Candidatus Deferrimicrobium sp.]
PTWAANLPALFLLYGLSGSGNEQSLPDTMFWTPCNSEPLRQEGLAISTFRTGGQNPPHVPC